MLQVEIFICAMLIINIIIIFYIITSNKLDVFQIKIEEAVSSIDIALSKRYNVLTKMIEIVKNYTKYEKDTLFKINEIAKGISLNEKANLNKQIDDELAKIYILTKSYPKLKANENFKVLQKTIIEVEEHLQAARRVYNSNVSMFNQLVLKFPTNIVAKTKSLKEKEFFKM